MKAALALGPVLFNWGGEALRDFYFRVADEAAIDTVHIGEIVCLKRGPFFAPYLGEVVKRLHDAGKEIVLSGLALISTDREAESMRALAADPDLLVEVNDLGLVDALAGRPHVVGPFVNVYNDGTLAYLAGRGAIRACLPPELPASSLAELARTSPIPLEVLVFGRVPLAISARCFHARAHGLLKDGCQFVCGQDPDGLPVRTLDAEPFLAVNGTQTLSHTCLNLAGELGRLRGMGIARFRLSPHSSDMTAVARLFRDVIDGHTATEDAHAALTRLVPDMSFSDGFFHALEGFRFHRRVADVE